jgi:hypothetical protein
MDSQQPIQNGSNSEPDDWFTRLLSFVALFVGLLLIELMSWRTYRGRWSWPLVLIAPFALSASMVFVIPVFRRCLQRFKRP